MIRDVAQYGRAPALGARGRWFESSHPDRSRGLNLWDSPLANNYGRSPCFREVGSGGNKAIRPRDLNMFLSQAEGGRMKNFLLGLVLASFVVVSIGALADVVPPSSVEVSDCDLDNDVEVVGVMVVVMPEPIQCNREAGKEFSAVANGRSIRSLMTYMTRFNTDLYVGNKYAKEVSAYHWSSWSWYGPAHQWVKA